MDSEAGSFASNSETTTDTVPHGDRSQGESRTLFWAQRKKRRTLRTIQMAPRLRMQSGMAWV